MPDKAIFTSSHGVFADGIVRSALRLEAETGMGMCAQITYFPSNVRGLFTLRLNQSDRIRLQAIVNAVEMGMRRVVRGVIKLLYFCWAIFQGLALLVALMANRRFFDRKFYIKSNKKKLIRKIFPLLDFCFLGNKRLLDPNPWFSQIEYAANHPDCVKYGPVLHFLIFTEGMPFVRFTDNAIAPVSHTEPAAALPLPVFPSLAPSPSAPLPLPPPDQMTRLWPRIHDDLFELRDVAHNASPTDGVRYRLTAQQNRFEPARAGHLATTIVDAIPDNVRHLVVVPWLGLSGGSEKVTERFLALLRAHYGADELCIFAPDSVFELAIEQRMRFDIPIIAINDVAPDASPAERLEIFDRVMIERRPPVVHCINSMTGWEAFRRYGRFYRDHSKLYVNIYSDTRFTDGAPVGYFWDFLPVMIDDLAGVLVDNETVARKARDYFGFTDRQAASFHVVRTPVLGLDGTRAPYRLAPIDTRAKPVRSLWMSRIAVEKRLDVLRTLAIRMPERHFDIYGAVLSQSIPVDMSWTESLANVSYRGAFGTLSDFDMTQYDSYLFTTAMEGMPIALLEVAMLGLPIVAPDVGGISELVRSDTGWLVSGSDAIYEYVAALEHIRRDPDEARRRAEAARRLILDRHSWEAFSSTIGNIPHYLQPSARAGQGRCA